MRSWVQHMLLAVSKSCLRKTCDDGYHCCSLQLEAFQPTLDPHSAGKQSAVTLMKLHFSYKCSLPWIIGGWDFTNADGSFHKESRFQVGELSLARTDSICSCVGL